MYFIIRTSTFNNQSVPIGTVCVHELRGLSMTFSGFFLGKFVISKFFPAKSNPSSCVFIFICHSIQKIPKMCNLTPKMVSRDIKFMTKIFLLKSYHKSCVFIFICRSIQNIPKMCNLTPKMVSRDTKF